VREKKVPQKAILSLFEKQKNQIRLTKGKTTKKALYNPILRKKAVITGFSWCEIVLILI